jgi:hypothetical protein
MSRHELRQSSSAGSTDRPLTLPDAILAAAAARPDLPTIFCSAARSESVSLADLVDRAARGAAAFRGLGVQPGDSVAVQVPPDRRSRRAGGGGARRGGTGTGGAQLRPTRIGLHPAGVARPTARDAGSVGPASELTNRRLLPDFSPIKTRVSVQALPVSHAHHRFLLPRSVPPSRLAPLANGLLAPLRTLAIDWHSN